MLDCDSGVLAYDLARRTDLYVCAVFTDAQKAAAAREKFSKANVLASRISVWRQAPGARLPYASNFADLIVSEGAAAGGALPADNGEISRLLKPIRGVALVGGRQEKAALDKWAADTKQKVWTVFKKHEMHWAKRVRPPIPNGGGWVGPLGGPERTNCSHDKALKGPLAVAWYGQPYIRGSVGRPPLIANGVMLCPTDTNTLEAYDQYNGRQLWKYTANNFGRYFSSTGCAGGNYAFTVYYGRCLRLDLWNGGPPVEVPNPFPGAQWGQITLSRGGKTLWGTGHAKKWRGMFAIDVTGGQTLWKCGGPDEGMKWGGWSAVADGRMFIVGGKAEGEQREQALSETRAYLKAHDAKRLDAFEKTLAKRRTVVLAALDATTGRVLYEHGIDLTNRGGFYGAAGGRLVFGRVARAGGRARKHWGIQYGPRPGFGMAASDGATGKLVWNELGDIRFPPVVTNDAIHAESWVVDLKTGKRRQRPHPISGKPSDQVWARMGKHCGGYNGSENFIFGRSYGVGYFDTLNDSGIYVSMHSRNNCNPDVASGGGMMIKPPLNLGCRCPWSLPFTVAMAQAQVQPEVPFLYFRSGHALPVKHMRLNFGAAGERRDAKGNLWLRVERSVGGHMKDYQINYQTKMVFHEGADWSRRNVLQSSVHTRIENTDTPFVFTTAKRGLKSCVLPVTKAGEGKGTYTVRLGFSAPSGDKLGQRVFDVKLNGKVLLKDFDIVKEAGKTDRAVWKETTLEPDGDLVIEFVAAEPKPSLDQMPLLSAVEIIRKEITTLGFKSPRALWLGGSKLAKVVDVELANLRPSASSGKIVIKAPKGFEVSVTDDVALELPVGGRTKIAVTVKADGKAKPGVHWVKMKIVGAGGKVELEHKLAVEWLGDLEQRVLRGGVRQFRSPGPHWGLVLSGRTFFAVSEGAGKTGDAGLPYAGFPVGIPKELYGKIKSVRVRLHASPSQRRVLASLFSSPRDSGPLKRGDWGIVRQLKGPPWPDLNKVVFPARPETLPEKVKLRPTKWDPNVVEAPVPGSIDHVTKSHQIYLAIEPTELNGPVYWNDRAGDREKAPALIVDYDPRPARPDK